MALHSAVLCSSLREDGKCGVPAGAVGVDPSQPTENVQNEALRVLRGRDLLTTLTQCPQQLLMQLRELQHRAALHSGGKTSNRQYFNGFFNNNHKLDFSHFLDNCI